MATDRHVLEGLGILPDADQVLWCFLETNVLQCINSSVTRPDQGVSPLWPLSDSYQSTLFSFVAQFQR